MWTWSSGFWGHMIGRTAVQGPNGKLIKIGAKVVRHSRKIIFQMAEVAVPGELFQAILEGIRRL